MGNIAYYILIGVLAVGMIAMMVVQGRKSKKAQDDYMAMLDALRVGVKVKMVSGLLGRIKEIREEAPGFKTVVIETGDAKNPNLMTFVIEAVQGIVNEEAINKLNIQKAAEELKACEEKAEEAQDVTKLNGEAVSESPAKKSTKSKAKKSK